MASGWANTGLSNPFQSPSRRQSHDGVSVASDERRDAAERSNRRLSYDSASLDQASAANLVSDYCVVPTGLLILDPVQLVA